MSTIRDTDGNYGPRDSVRLLGPFRVNYDSSDLSSGRALFTVAAGTVVVALWAVFIEYWDGPSLPYAMQLGPFTDPLGGIGSGQDSVVYDPNAPSDAGDSYVTSGLYGPSGILKASPYWVSLVDDLPFGVGVDANALNATRGVADVYALIAEPA